MKQTTLSALLLVLVAGFVLVTSGCEKNGDVKIFNQTSYPLYTTISNKPVTISPGGYTKYDVKTDTQYPLTDEVGKYVKVDMKGETYQIWDSFEERYVDFTHVWVKAGETTKVYARPNRASVKIINNSGIRVQRVTIQKNYSQGIVTNTSDVIIPDGGSWYKPIDYTTSSNDFYLLVQVLFDDNRTMTFGDSTVKKHLDEQFLIELEPIIPN